MLARLDDFIDGDAVHHGSAAVVAEVELVAGFDVLDDVVFAAVGGGEFGVGGAEQAHAGAVKAHAHVEGGGVVGDDEGGGFDCRHELSDIGCAHEVDDARVGSGEGEERLDL